MTNIVTKAAKLATPSGTCYALAKLLSISVNAVYLWEKQGYIPAKRVKKISSLTGIPKIDLYSAIPQDSGDD